MSSEITLRGNVTCPECGYRQEAEMPVNACQFFYRCVGCGTLLRPKEGECCVFCSYGDVPCPSRQRDEK